MSQNAYDIIEIAVLGLGCLVSLATLRSLIIYTQKTSSIAESTHKTALEAAAMAQITEEALEISSKILEEMREERMPKQRLTFLPTSTRWKKKVRRRSFW